MAFNALTSTNLDSYDYDDAQRILHVRFKSGLLYSYRDVEPSVALGLGSADSPGKYFNANIKDRYRQV